MRRDEGNGDGAGLDTLMPEVYDELRVVARGMLGRADRAGFTLQATAVVHEAWARLARNGAKPNDRHHLVMLASRVIRQVVIDHARGRKRIKRGGDREKMPLLDEAVVSAESCAIDLIALDEALGELAGFGERQAQVVELKFFGGLSMLEIAEVIGVSKRTVEDDWSAARAWLEEQLGE